MDNIIFVNIKSRAIASDTMQQTQFSHVKGIQDAIIDFLFFILKVANIRCFTLIKCSEQEVKFKKYVIMMP